jgi:hypothetical protein
MKSSGGRERRENGREEGLWMEGEEGKDQMQKADRKRQVQIRCLL